MLKADLEKENKELKEQNEILGNEVENIKKMLESLMNQKQEKNNALKVEENMATKEEYVDYDLEPIEPNKYIRVTSLCNSRLNLTTERNGKGRVFKFSHFGQTKNIPFQVLEEIVGSNESMAKNGRFFIQDKKAVKLLMLEDAYNKILDEKTINAIVDSKESNLLEVFKMTPKKQQDHIVSMIIKKVVDGSNMDYNQLQAISEIYGKDLITKINDAKNNR